MYDKAIEILEKKRILLEEFKNKMESIKQPSNDEKQSILKILYPEAVASQSSQEIKADNEL